MRGFTSVRGDACLLAMCYNWELCSTKIQQTKFSWQSEAPQRRGPNMTIGDSPGRDTSLSGTCQNDNLNRWSQLWFTSQVTQCC